MHVVVTDCLEEYLSGSLEPAVLGRIEAHLNGCEGCRQEIRCMRELSRRLGSLLAQHATVPSAGFSARVLEQVGRQASVPTFSNLLSWHFAFARRVAFASLVTLAVLGSYLVFHEAAYRSSPSPESLMAQEESRVFTSSPAQDNMLVTLTAYEH